MTRWSLSNIFMPISHGQFLDYVEQFQRAAQNSFDTKCELEIRALTAPKVYTTFMDDRIQENLDDINDQNTIIKTTKLSDITKEIWDKSGYVEVTVKPTDPDHAPSYAFGHAEFKGERPRQATFYLQPDGKDAKDFMLGNSTLKIAGDGFDSNGSRSHAVPASIGRMFRR